MTAANEVYTAGTFGEGLEDLLAKEERRIGRDVMREFQCLYPSGHNADCRICQLRKEWDALPRSAA